MRYYVVAIVAILLPLLLDAVAPARQPRVRCPKRHGNHSLPEVRCYADPCQFASCPLAASTAGLVCRSNYCGGCNHEFYANNTRLSKSACCEPSATCPVDPCATRRCRAFRRATCESNRCGGCNALFYFNNVDVTAYC